MHGARTTALCIFFASFLKLVSSHGFLYDPPQRSSLWRHGYNTTVNNDDNAINCGGRSTQYERNAGKCGLCGDAVDAVRDHESGGKYYTNIIPRYYKMGREINVTVRITTNHKGYFEFRLCPETGLDADGFEECLNRNLLPVRMRGGESSFRYEILTNLRGDFNLSVTLPNDVTCDRCLFQWKYVTDKEWGDYPEEWFVNCADIGIYEKEPPTTSKATTSTTTQMETTSADTTTRETTQGTTLTPDPVNEKECKPLEPYAKIPGMDFWCQVLCPLHCYSVVCTCPTSNNV